MRPERFRIIFWEDLERQVEELGRYYRSNARFS